MPRFHRLVRLPGEGRSPAVSDRALGLSFSGRFVDEVLSGTWSALTPTFRSHFGLSLLQVGLLDQVLSWVALVVEPPASLLIDARSRRVLLTLGATCVGLSTLLMGLAPSYAAMLAALAIYGVGSGPLAHTADVVNVEAYPDDPERAFGRATSSTRLERCLHPPSSPPRGGLALTGESCCQPWVPDPSPWRGRSGPPGSLRRRAVTMSTCWRSCGPTCDSPSVTSKRARGCSYCSPWTSSRRPAS